MAGHGRTDGTLSGTLAGFLAVLMWSLLALLTARSGDVPPFQLSAMSFSIASLVGLSAFLLRRGSFRAFRQPPKVWLLGIAGLFGYHALYFAALRRAPAAEASLIAYLWPLLIVIGSALLPGERLRPFHIVGAMLGLLGAALIVTGGTGMTIQREHLSGDALAFLCAFTWAGYSLLSRRFATVPSDIVTGFCAATALLSVVAHGLFEETIWPTGFWQWSSVALLGLLPVGAAFFVWDYGVKRGDIQLIGAGSYVAPLLSTVILIAAGEAAFTWTILIAAGLITIGACLAALPLFKPLLRRNSLS